jgi:hypothetical protein
MPTDGAWKNCSSEKRRTKKRPNSKKNACPVQKLRAGILRENKKAAPEKAPQHLHAIIICPYLSTAI